LTWIDKIAVLAIASIGEIVLEIVGCRRQSGSAGISVNRRRLAVEKDCSNVRMKNKRIRCRKYVTVIEMVFECSTVV
jgi:hypothetical protein